MRTRNQNRKTPILFMLGSVCLFLIFGLTNASELIPPGDYSITKGGCFCKTDVGPNKKFDSFNFSNFPTGPSSPIKMFIGEVPK